MIWLRAWCLHVYMYTYTRLLARHVTLRVCVCVCLCVCVCVCVHVPLLLLSEVGTTELESSKPSFFSSRDPILSLAAVAAARGSRRLSCPATSASCEREGGWCMGRACMLASTCFLSLAHNYYISTIVLKMFAYNGEPGLKTHL